MLSDQLVCLSGLSHPSGVKGSQVYVICGESSGCLSCACAVGETTAHFLYGYFLFSLQKHSSPISVINTKKTEIEVEKVGFVPVRCSVHKPVKFLNLTLGLGYTDTGRNSCELTLTVPGAQRRSPPSHTNQSWCLHGFPDQHV